MAEELEIVIGANVDDAKQGINSLSGVINDFARQGKLSIAVVEQSMAQLRTVIKQTSNPEELRKLNTALTELQRKLNSLKLEGGLASQLGGVTRATKIAHGELDQISRSLALVASGSERGIDSLSNLVFSFERLSNVTGGIGAGITALGETLLGPAGLVLAFTTLLPAITSVVEELFNSVSSAEANQKAFDDLNKVLGDSKKAFDDLQTKVKFLDEIGPVNLEIQFGKGFQTDILDIGAKVLELNDEILKQQEVLTNAQNARLAAQKAANESATKENKKQVEDSLKAEADANKTLEDLLNQRSILFRKTALTRTQNQRESDKKVADEAKKAQEEALKQLEEFNRRFSDRVKRLADSFNIPIDLKFSVDDTPGQAFDKAKAIIKGIEDHEIRLKVIIPDKIETPKLEPEIDKPFFKKQFDDLVKGLTVPLQFALDQPSLLQTEDQIKQIFSGFSNTNIFTEFGRNAGNKFRDALLQSVQSLEKGFIINPQLDTTDIINSLTSSLSGIKEIQLKILGTEDFASAIRTLRDLHDAGVAAGEAVEKAFIAAGRSSEDASKAGKAITASFGGITEQAADIARTLSTTLTPAFTGLFDAILEGKDPVKAFFEVIGKSLEDLAGKLIATELERAILSIVATSTTAATAIQATTIATQAASAAGVAAAGTAAAAAAGAAAAATAASAAAAAAVIAAAAAKAASAAIGFGNPLALLGLIGGFFAEGGDPPVNKPSIVGEKGWELFVPRVPGTIYSHEDSVKMLTSASVKSSTVKESETIREYLIATKVSQLIKEHFSSVSIPAMVRDSVRLIVIPIESKLSETVKSITANNDKLTAYSYKLHESTDRTNNSIVSLRESFNSDATEKIVSSFKESLKDSTFKDYSEKTIQAFTNTDTAVSKSESVQSPQISHDLSNITTSMKDAVASTVSTTIKSITASTDKLTAYVYKLHDVNNTIQSTKESFVSDRSSDHFAEFSKLVSSQSKDNHEKEVAFNRFVSSIKDSIVNTTFSEKVESFEKDRFVKDNYFESFSDSVKSFKGLQSPETSIVKEKGIFLNQIVELSGILKTFSSSVSGSSLIKSDKFISSIQDKVTFFKEKTSSDYVSVIHPEAKGTSHSFFQYEYKESFEKLIGTFKESFSTSFKSDSNLVDKLKSDSKVFDLSKYISASFSKIIATYTDKIKDSSFVSDNNTELIKLFTLLKDSSVSNSSGFERFNTDTIFKTVRDSVKDSSKQSYDRLIERLLKDASSSATDSNTTTVSYEGFAEKLKENLFKQSTFSHDKLISSATYDSLIDKLKTSTFSTDKHTSLSGFVSSLNNYIEKLYSVARSDSSNNEIFSDSSRSDQLSSNRIEKYIATQKDFIHDTASVIEKLVSSFVSVTGKEFSHKADVSSRSVISISDHSHDISSSVKIAETFRQSLVESFSKLSTQLINNSTATELISKLFTQDKDVFKSLSSTANNSESEYFEQLRSIIQQRGFERTLKELLRESFSGSKIISSDKFIQSLLKDIYKTDTRSDKSTSDRSTFRQLDLFESEKSFTTDKSESFFKTVLSNLTRSTDHSKQVFDKISERINERLTVNTLKSDKLTDKFHSVHVEKIVNNNFFSESMSSSKEFMKSMSLEKFGKMFNIPAFAQGGAVFGPTLAILGEGFGISRSNPEFVGTASQLKGIQGGSFDVNVNVNGDISFDMGKLAVALNRQERSHIRTNGKKPF